MKVPISQALAELPQRPYVALVDGWWRVIWSRPDCTQRVINGREYYVLALLDSHVTAHVLVTDIPAMRALFYPLLELCCAVALWRHENPDAVPDESACLR